MPRWMEGREMEKMSDAKMKHRNPYTRSLFHTGYQLIGYLVFFCEILINSFLRDGPTILPVGISKIHSPAPLTYPWIIKLLVNLRKLKTFYKHFEAA